MRLILIGLIFFAHSTYAAKCGRVVVSKGDVTWSKKGTDKWKKAGLARKICSGDQVKTGPSSKTKIIMVDKNVLSLQENSHLIIKKYVSKKEKKKVSLNLLYGSLRSKVAQKYKGKKPGYIIETKAAVVGVRGTEFLTQIDGTNDKADSLRVVTFSGEVQVRPFDKSGSPGRPLLVRPGQMLEIGSRGAAGKVRRLSPQKLRKMNKESRVASQTPGGGTAGKPSPMGWNARKNFEGTPSKKGLERPRPPKSQTLDGLPPAPRPGEKLPKDSKKPPQPPKPPQN